MMNKKSIPGWTTDIEETSNAVFKVTLTHAYGRKTEIIDDATDETIETAIGYAFDIEKQISVNWNLFLYDLAVQELTGTEIKNKAYDNKAFGSWTIEIQDKRLIYDGKDSLLIRQDKLRNNVEVITKEELSYLNFVGQIKRLTSSCRDNNNTLPKT